MLTAAAEEGRILVSHDRKTMPWTFAQFIQSKTNPGLFLVSQKTDLLVAIENLLLAWNASDSEEWINRIVVVPF